MIDQGIVIHTVRRKTLEYITEHPRKSTKALAEELDIPLPSMRVAVSALVADGLVRRISQPGRLPNLYEAGRDDEACGGQPKQKSISEWTFEPVPQQSWFSSLGI